MRYIIFFVLFFSSFNLFSQRKVLVEVDLGAAIPMNKELKDVFDLGFGASIGSSINIWNEKFYIKPGAGVKWYYKEIEQVNSVTEHLRTWKAGFEVRYYVLKHEQLRLAPFVKFDYNWTTNYYSGTYGYNHFTNTSTTATSDNYLEGQDFSWFIGSVVNFRDFYFKIDYEFYKPRLKVNQAIIDEAHKQGVIIEHKPLFNFNSLTFSIGYSYWIK